MSIKFTDWTIDEAEKRQLTRALEEQTLLDFWQHLLCVLDDNCNGPKIEKQQYQIALDRLEEFLMESNEKQSSNE